MDGGGGGGEESIGFILGLMFGLIDVMTFYFYNCIMSRCGDRSVIIFFKVTDFGFL
jgi:hypothetical protein